MEMTILQLDKEFWEGDVLMNEFVFIPYLSVIDLMGLMDGFGLI